MTQDTASLLLFLSASIALILTPGPDMVFVTTRGIALGRRAGIFSALGIAAGLLVHTTAAALGLALLFKISLTFYYAVKYLGVAYLVYLGAKTLLGGGSPVDLNHRVDEQPAGRMFWQGFLTNLLNPKIALFFMSFLPQFVVYDYLFTVQVFALGMTYLVLSLLALVVIALLADRIGALLREKPNLNRGLNWFSGSVLIGLGLSMAFSKR